MENNFYKELIEKSHIGYALLKAIDKTGNQDGDFMFIEVNKVFEDLTGLKAHSIQNKKISETYSDSFEQPLGYIADLVHDAFSKTSTPNEYYSDKLKKLFRVSAHLVEPDYVALLFSEISIHSHGQEIAAQKPDADSDKHNETEERLKSAFMVAINHELRAPLNHILGFSEIIKNNAMDYEIREFATIIHKSGTEFLAVIEDIFDLAVTKEATVKTRNESFSGIDIFMEAKLRLEQLVAEAGKNQSIKLVYNPDQNLYTSIFTSDKTKIKQVLSNMFKNAVKHTETGMIELSMHSENKDNLLFGVKYSSTIASKIKVNEIFDYITDTEHFNLHFLYRDTIIIGLALAIKIAEALNGKLYEKELENGINAMYFSVPAEITVTETRTGEYDYLFEVPKLKGKTIILADDDIIALKMTKKILSSTNANVITANNGEEAVKQFRKHPDAALVLMDLMMPVMDGYSATENIKALKPELPVIALTANAFQIDKENALKAGCNSIITKPVTSALLFSELNKYLKPNA